MSFLGSLVSWLPIPGASTIGKVLDVAGGIGSVAGQAAQGSSNQRMAENQQLMQMNTLANQQYNTQQNAQMQAGQTDLNRKLFSENARGGRAKQALIASLLQNYQPGHVGVAGVKDANLSGGLGASLQNPESRASMAQLYKDALAAQMTPDTFQGGQVLTPPTMQQPKGSSMLEKILGGTGLGGSLLGAIGGGGSAGGGSPMDEIPRPTQGLGGVGLPGSVSPQTLAALLAQQNFDGAQ